MLSSISLMRRQRTAHSLLSTRSPDDQIPTQRQLAPRAQADTRTRVTEPRGQFPRPSARPRRGRRPRLPAPRRPAVQRPRPVPPRVRHGVARVVLAQVGNFTQAARGRPHNQFAYARSDRPRYRPATAGAPGKAAGPAADGGGTPGLTSLNRPPRGGVQDPLDRPAASGDPAWTARSPHEAARRVWSRPGQPGR